MLLHVSSSLRKDIFSLPHYLVASLKTSVAQAAERVKQYQVYCVLQTVHGMMITSQ